MASRASSSRPRKNTLQRRARHELTALAEDHPQTFPPILIHAQQSPLDLRRKVFHLRVCCGMNLQGRRRKKQQRRLDRELPSGKITELLELAALMMPVHSRPVVQALHRQMQILTGFDLDDGE